MWHGNYIIEDDKLIIISSIDAGEPQERIYFDIINGTCLSVNEALSYNGARSDLLIAGPTYSYGDSIDGMLFEPDVKESLKYNFDRFM